ncbi:MAG: hypothetical protein QOF94_702 [Acidobacteriaceae bacterium]|jgi:Protein of unknown function (DUF2934)
MAARQNHESYENHHKAAELHDRAAHAHRIAQKDETGDASTGHEKSRQALELSRAAQKLTQRTAVKHGVIVFGHDEIAALAFELWQARGSPFGSPEEDWFRAEAEFGARGPAH